MKVNSMRFTYLYSVRQKVKNLFIFKILKVRLYEIKLKQNLVWDSQTENNLNKNLALNQLPNTLKLETQKENTNDVYKFYYITLTN